MTNYALPGPFICAGKSTEGVTNLLFTDEDNCFRRTECWDFKTLHVQFRSLKSRAFKNHENTDIYTVNVQER